ncbi:hypothetical protein SBI67_24815 [Mycolicibacterium sp. 120266]|uniref:hypothetical protein n=1 Tax=Mycolicibacterium sp. 120266 TaxID=3090601 RepID=UPI00299F526C|nr:hypothetical protein [Mycolicibacterium sp. 120266]MDX1875354.1 hypothetical protein [Mycolicibacterium sp. 120266]
MQRALRPYVTTGIALVGAGVIAVTPVAAPPPEVHLPTVTLAANPVADAYRQLLQNTWTNVQAVGSQAWNQGMPILEQFLVNTRANLDIAAKVPPQIFDALKYSAQQIRPTLDAAGAQLRAGQVGDAINTLWSGLVINPLVGVAFPLLNTLQIPVNMAKTFARVVEALPSAILIGVGLPVLSTVTAVVNSLGTVAQGLYDGITTGNLGAVLTTVLTAPATVIGGVLNGDPNTGTVGLINGLVAGILNARQTIADAMAPPATASVAKTTGPAALATAAATALPATTAATVTLDTAPAPPAVDGTKIEGTQAKTTEPATTTPAAETGTGAVAATDTKTSAAAPAETKTEPVEVKTAPTSANGATDLSDGNKVSPGDKVGEKSSDTTSSAPGKTTEPTAPTDPKQTDTTSPSGAVGSAPSSGSGSSGATAGASSTASTASTSSTTSTASTSSTAGD